VARHRYRRSVAGANFDAAAARVLADLVRTDRHKYRPLAADSPEVEAVKLLARAIRT
jgi:hypothetical protein